MNSEDLTIGIRLDYLLEELKKFEKYIQNQSTREVCNKIIKPFTFKNQCSLAVEWRKTNPTRIGKPDYFISHAWNYKFKDLLKSLSNYFQNNKKVFLWLDVICINQHLSSSNYDESFWYNTFKDAIHSIGKTIMVLSPWDDPIPLTRAWCIWELYCTIENESFFFDIAMTQKSEKTFLSDMDDNPLHMNAMLAAIDCENSHCSETLDKERIHTIIQQTIGFQTMNKRIFEVMRNWVLQRYTKELESRKAKLNDDNYIEVIIKTLNSLGRLYQHQGMYDQAYLYLYECYEKCLAYYDYNDPMTIRSLNSLAGYHSKRGEYEQALRIAEDCLQRQTQLFLKEEHQNNPDNKEININDDPRIIMLFNNLGIIHQSLGNYSQAIEYFQRCINNAPFTKDHHFLLLCHMNLAVTISFDEERLNEAIDLLEKNVEKFQKHLGENNLDTIIAEEHLAKLYSKKSSKDNEMNEKEDHTSSANVNHHHHHHHHSDMKEASIDLYENCLKKKRILLGENNIDYLKSLQEFHDFILK